MYKKILEEYVILLIIGKDTFQTEEISVRTGISADKPETRRNNVELVIII